LKHLINYDSPAAISAFLEARSLAAQKKFGQNFLINPAARSLLLDALEIAPGDEVYEIGPGLGAMTRGLLERGARVRAFELDRGFCAALEELFGENSRFTLVEGDALRSVQRAAFTVPAGAKLLGNLPYNIAGKLLGSFIERGLFFSKMVITVQRELAARITARRGESDYSSLSVLVSSAYQARPLATLKGESFFPVPRVTSRALCLERLERAAALPPPAVYALIRALFASRRKTVKNNLAAFLGARFGRASALERAGALLEESGIAPGERAERLLFDDFVRLAHTLESEKAHSRPNAQV
jgi:16S rRNA (adenine1518-N6/adenine1519-N6)-dimethyltransferase